MDIVIPNYWGWEYHQDYYQKRGDYFLRNIAFQLVKRMRDKDAKRTWFKRQSFRRYFDAYKRSWQFKHYPGLGNKKTQKYIWSFAVYVALNWGYDIEELEKDWMYSIHELKYCK